MEVLFQTSTVTAWMIACAWATVTGILVKPLMVNGAVAEL